jgi:hypothetical protein
MAVFREQTPIRRVKIGYQVNIVAEHPANTFNWCLRLNP